MLYNLLNNRKFLIFIHIIFGYLATLPLFSTFYGALTVILPIILIVASKNNKEQALIFSAYIVGAEVFIRMSRGFFFYETGKYAVMLFLILGVFYGEFKQRFSIQYLTYILLLMVGIIFTNVPEGESLRKNILFNLSGPLVLGISALYAYKRTLTFSKIKEILFYALLPLFSMICYLYFRTPDLEEIVFGGDANFDASGGYGPNQVATAIGFGIFILTIFLLTKEKLTGYFFLDAIFLIYFVYRGLLTFSRGGLIAGLICIIVFIFFYSLYKRISFSVILKYLLIASFFIFGIWLYLADVTGGMINNRYTGKNARGIKKDITSGRTEIINVQFDNFLENPLGIGVGNGKYKRLFQESNVTATSHNELGRLLEEHGYLGLVILLTLMVVPLFNFGRSNNYQRAFIISFYVLWFLTINHSAMRIALPGFIYGLSLIIITKLDE